MRNLTLGVFVFLYLNCLSQQSFVWAKQLVGLGFQSLKCVTTDGANNIYYCGSADGQVDFDPGPSTYTISALGYSDVFFSKLDASGNLLWAKRLGKKNAFAEAMAIKVSAANDIYVVGYFTDTVDFDPSPLSFNLISSGLASAFVAKYTNNGTLTWAKKVGGTGNQTANSLALDILGNVFVCGDFSGTSDFDPGPGTFNLSSAGAKTDGYILKLNASGNLLWAKSVGATEDDIIHSVAIDNSNNVVCAGKFKLTPDFDPGANIFNLTSNGQSDAFILKLDNSGNFEWASSWGGIYDDEANAVVSDAASNILVTGKIQEVTDFDPTPATYTLAGYAGSAFVAKFNSSGSVIWAKETHCACSEKGLSITTDNASNVYVAGEISGSGGVDYDPGPGIYSPPMMGGINGFMLKLTSTGNFDGAVCITTNGPNITANSICVDGQSRIISVGKFNNNTDFDPGPAFAYLSAQSSSDGFILKLNNLPVGLKELEWANRVFISPNPGNGQFNVQTPREMKITIVTSGGQIIKSFEAATGTNPVDITDYPSGVYLIQIISEMSVKTYKFIKI